MTLEQYQKAKQFRLQAEIQYRVRCPNCKKPRVTCYCAHIRSFSPATKFVILIHRDEVRRSVASGRMAHLCLNNSSFFEGTDFTEHVAVNALINDPKNYPVVLYPGRNSTDISNVETSKRQKLFPVGRQLVVFIIDATWHQAKRIKRLSQNLDPLPLISFTPKTLSTFSTVRKQPNPQCYSTIEAIHEFIELVADPAVGPHRNLLEVFGAMVKQQAEYQAKFGPKRRTQGS